MRDWRRRSRRRRIGLNHPPDDVRVFFEGGGLHGDVQARGEGGGRVQKRGKFNGLPGPATWPRTLELKAGWGGVHGGTTRHRKQSTNQSQLYMSIDASCSWCCMQLFVNGLATDILCRKHTCMCAQTYTLGHTAGQAAAAFSRRDACKAVEQSVYTYSTGYIVRYGSGASTSSGCATGQD